MKLVSGNPGLGLGESDARYLRLTGGTLAGNLNVGSGRIVATAPAGTIPQSGDPSAGQTLEHTWNGAGNTWTAFLVNVTDTASAAASKFLDLQVGGSSRVSVSKSGLLRFDNVAGAIGFYSSGSLKQYLGYGTGSRNLFSSDVRLSWESGTTVTDSPDLGISRNSAGVLEINSGTSGTLRDWKARRGIITEYQEVLVSSEPSAPTSGARIWADLVGGKVFLMARFPTGASQVLAQEP